MCWRSRCTEAGKCPTPPADRESWLPPEGTGILFADPAHIKDTDGLPFVMEGTSVTKLRNYSYQWILVDAETAGGDPSSVLTRRVTSVSTPMSGI